MKHTLIPVKGEGDKLSFDLVHEDRPRDVIANFTDLDNASHMCNRLNGGHSKDFSILLDMIKERNIFISLGALLSNCSSLLSKALARANAESRNAKGDVHGK